MLIRPIKIDDVRRATDLVRAHYEEVEGDKAGNALDPDWVAFGELERAGRLFCLGVFDGWALVGYSLNIDVPAHLHYRGTHYAQNSAFFVAKKHRRGGTGRALMAATEAAAKALGATRLLTHAKVGTAYERMLDRSGFRVVEVMHGKELH